MSARVMVRRVRICFASTVAVILIIAQPSFSQAIAPARAPGPAPGPTSEVEVAFAGMAAELVAGLEGAPGDNTRIGVWPFDRPYPVLDEHADRYEDMITAALVGAAKGRFQIKSHELDNLVRELEQAPGQRPNPIADLAVAAAVDLLLMGELQKIGELLEIRFRIQSLTDATVLAEASRNISFPGTRPQGVPLQSALEQAANQFRRDARGLAGVRTTGIRYRPSGAGTPLGEYLSDQFRTALSRAFNNVLTHGAIRVFDADEALPAGVFELSGDYWDWGETIQLRIVLQSADGTEYSWQGHIDVGTLPPALSVAATGEFGPIAHNRLGQVDIQIETQKGTNPVYRFGEAMDIRIRLDRDAWLYCYYLQGHDGVLVRMFPNAYHPGAALSGPQSHTIPGELFPFAFDIREPAGVDLIKCFAAPRDVTAQLPPYARGEDGDRLPPDARFRLHDDFRRLGAAITEATLVVTTLQ